MKNPNSLIVLFVVPCLLVPLSFTDLHPSGLRTDPDLTGRTLPGLVVRGVEDPVDWTPRPMRLGTTGKMKNKMSVLC